LLIIYSTTPVQGYSASIEGKPRYEELEDMLAIHVKGPFLFNASLVTVHQRPAVHI